MECHKGGAAKIALFHEVEPLLHVFTSVKIANNQKVAKNASLQRTPLSHRLKTYHKNMSNGPTSAKDLGREPGRVHEEALRE